LSLVVNTYFEILDERAAGGNYLAGPETGGPWAAELQHGGPPNALLVHEAERVTVAQTGRTDLLAVRLAAEFVGPVPVAEVSTDARIVRAARSAVLVEATLHAGGRECLHARVWLVGERDTAAVAPPLPAPVDPPTGLPALNMRFPYGDSIEWRTVHGSIDQPGPGVVWARPRLDLLAGQQWSGLQRAALIGDSASGISSVLDWSAWSFLNVDLDVHLSRPVIGDWLHMDAATVIGATGSGLARSTLTDVCGPVGSTLQTLVVAPARDARQHSSEK
jgi:Thioesterase-like superfamily